MKFLKEYKNLEEFENFVEVLSIENWCIFDQTAEKRITYLTDRPYFISLVELTQQQSISAQNTEIISWLDTLNQLYYVFGRIDKRFNDIRIIQELEIPTSKKRADYVLFKDNKVLIIEFSFNKWEKEYQYETKLHQAIHYKELISNLLPSHIEVGTYTFIVEAECNPYGDPIYKDSLYSTKKRMPNFDKQFELAHFIMDFFTNTKHDAYYELLLHDEQLNRFKEEDIKYYKSENK